MKTCTKPEAVLSLFDAPKTPGMLRLASDVMSKVHKVHYFDRKTGVTRDISTLDPDAEENGKAGWGGLSEFSGRVNAIVARAVANANRQSST